MLGGPELSDSTLCMRCTVALYEFLVLLLEVFVAVLTYGHLAVLNAQCLSAGWKASPLTSFSVASLDTWTSKVVGGERFITLLRHLWLSALADAMLQQRLSPAVTGSEGVGENAGTSHQV